MRARCDGCASGRDAVALVGAVRADGLPTWPDRPVCLRCLAALVVGAHRGGGLVAVQYFEELPEPEPVAVPRAGALRVIRGGLAVAALLLLPWPAAALPIVPPMHCGCTLVELPRLVLPELPHVEPERARTAAEVIEDDAHEPEPEPGLWAWLCVELPRLPGSPGGRPGGGSPGGPGGPGGGPGGAGGGSVPGSVPEAPGGALAGLAAAAWWRARRRR